MGARGYGISLRVFNSQDESMRGITTKTNNGPGFQCTKFSVFCPGPYRQKKSFRYTAKIGLHQISSGRFSFSATRYAITKAIE